MCHISEFSISPGWTFIFGIVCFDLESIGDENSLSISFFFSSFIYFGVSLFENWEIAK
jgi:hypothetical protein